MIPEEPPTAAFPAAASGADRRQITAAEATRASRRGWDGDAQRYQREHGAFLAGPNGTDLVWCPEGWLESQVQLLGNPSNLSEAVALDLGCGAGQAAHFLAQHCRQVIGVDLSYEQLSIGQSEVIQAGVLLLQADACDLPLASSSIDIVVSAFGVLAFVADLDPVFAEIARVLAPGGSATLSMPHPMRWVFPDDPSAESLTVVHAYSDRRAYVELDAHDEPTYVECHHTLADIVNAVAGAGLHIERVWEPDWRADPDHIWGGWSEQTVALVPRTLIMRIVPNRQPITSPSQ